MFQTSDPVLEGFRHVVARWLFWRSTRVTAREGDAKKKYGKWLSSVVPCEGDSARCERKMVLEVDGSCKMHQGVVSVMQFVV